MGWDPCFKVFIFVNHRKLSYGGGGASRCGALGACRLILCSDSIGQNLKFIFRLKAVQTR